MSLIWSNELELEFLERFQAEPVLWNANFKDYKNKLKKNNAWNRISALMEVPIDELKNKKISLFASYRGYKNKIKKSENSEGDIYKPIWFAYEIMDSFLGNTTKCKKTINNTEELSTSSGGNEVQIKLEENQSQTVNTNATPVSTIHRRKHPSELFDAEKVIAESLSTFNATVKRNAPQSIPKEDDCDLYAKFLAIKLRKLSERKRLTLMHDIDAMFLDTQETDDSDLSDVEVSPGRVKVNKVFLKRKRRYYKRNCDAIERRHQEREANKDRRHEKKMRLLREMFQGCPDCGHSD